MTRIHAGALLERIPGHRYRKALHFAELQLVGRPPKQSTLKGWATDAAGVDLSLVAPRGAVVSSKGPFRADDNLESTLEWTIEACEALDTRFVVVPTDATFTTGQRDRELFTRWLDRWPDARRASLVWEPRGLWEPHTASRFARDQGIILGFDPLEAPVPENMPTYARLRSVGLRRRFDETLLLDIVDALSDREEAWVAFESPKSFREACRLASLGDGG